MLAAWLFVDLLDASLPPSPVVVVVVVGAKLTVGRRRRARLHQLVGCNDPVEVGLGFWAAELMALVFGGGPGPVGLGWVF